MEFRPIETARLTIEVPSHEDFDDIFAIYSDQGFRDAMAIPSSEPTKDHVFQVIEETLGEWETGKAKTFTFRNAHGRIVGIARLQECEWEPSHGEEIVYAIHPTHQHQGYALEGVTAVVGFAFTQGSQNLVATISPENLASIRIVEKLGFTRIANRSNRWSDKVDDVFALSREQWTARS